ncbi:hypothetical protein BGZ97_006566 [Linnemannia gamsii]|uniref:Uncharacterized protein n=1 Tax=Linnemannia gamsii TaxID=64522 RepID=A0A9P6UEK9_9FUNG|nr:hypothetical protein BGZ97_006566 [Linnemannia gamsii]
MRKALSLITVVGLLASLASTAPSCFDSDARKQEVFTQAGHREPPTKPRDDGGIIYLPPTRSRNNFDLDAMMQELIRKDMTTTYRQPEYLESLRDKICVGLDAPGPRYDYILNCQIEILSKPVIRVIPAKAVSNEILCSSPTCAVAYEETVSVSTTHSTEVSLSVTAGAKPFGIGMEFTATAGYGYSNTAEESTTIGYTFNLDRGDMGYIGIVNAEVSATVRVSGCLCAMYPPVPSVCQALCLLYPTSNLNVNETGHHEAVILQNGKPRGYVSFVYTS